MNGFYGSAFGNILGTLYFLLFQCVGFLYIKRIFPKKGLLFHLLTGSVSGSVLLQWIPALFAFFFGFSMTAHIMALLFVVISLVLLYVFYHPATAVSSTAPTKDYRQLLRRNYAFLLLAGGTFVLFCILLSTHTILPKNDGLHVGQCTYGDLQMHLGIITSIANQQTFPPYYSISPWDRLCYPFLCDSISSSIYLFGASLRYAYMLPMYFAFFQVITGFYAIADVLFHDRAKSLAAWVLFFYNGGLGFVYFIDWSREGGYKFSIAQEFAGKNGYLYEIETSRGINVSEVLGADSPHPEQLEISVVDGILGSEVKGAWKVKHGKITGEYIANPNFRGRK